MGKGKEKELTRPVSITIRPSLAQRTTEAAKKRGLTRSKFICLLLMRELEGNEGQSLAA